MVGVQDLEFGEVHSWQSNTEAALTAALLREEDASRSASEEQAP